MTSTTKALILFGISEILCVIGAYLAIFLVTTHRGRHALVAGGFVAVAMVNVLFVLILILRPE